MALKIARMIALIALVISLFVTVDYGINLVNSLVPELQTDGNRLPERAAKLVRHAGRAV